MEGDPQEASLGGWGSERNKKRKPVNGVLTSQLPLWATGVQFYWETLEDHVKYASESVPLRVKEAGALLHHFCNSCGLRATLVRIDSSAFRTEFALQP